MDLVDLLETHTVVDYVNIDVSTAIAKAITSSSDVDDVLNAHESTDFKVFETLFRVDSMANPTGYWNFISQFYVFGGNVTVNGYSITNMHYYLKFVSISGTNITVKLGSIAGADDYGSNFTISLDTTYSLLTMLEYDPVTDIMYNGSWLCSVDVDGARTVVVNYWISDMTNMLAGDIPYAIQSHINGTWPMLHMRIYEPVFSGQAVSISALPKHRMWSGKRHLDHTYYEDDDIISYLLPPVNVMDGSAYDRTSVLEGIIADQDVEIALLTGRLTSSRAGFLDNINNASLLSINANMLSSLTAFYDIADALDTEGMSIADLILWIVDVWVRNRAQWALEDVDKFNITFDTSVGAKLDILSTFESIIASINGAINDWITANQDDLDNARINAPSGIGIPFSIDVDVLPTITFPRIKNITINGHFYEFGTIDINIVELFLKFCEIGWPHFSFPTFTDIVIPSSDSAYYWRDDGSGNEWKLGSQFDPVETYNVFRDFLGKDFPAAVIFFKILGLLKKVIGSHGLSDTVAKKVFNSVNMGNINEVVKASTNAKTAVDSLGSHTDIESVASVFGKLAKVYNSVQDEPANHDAITVMLNAIAGAIGLKLRL